MELDFRSESHFQDSDYSPNSTRWARPDFVGDPGLRSGLRQSPIESARVSDKSADFVWS